MGDRYVGGDAPITVQSMTTTKTHDIGATLQQIAELTAAGCDIVRVACPTDKDAAALPVIATIRYVQAQYTGLVTLCNGDNLDPAEVAESRAAYQRLVLGK